MGEIQKIKLLIQSWLHLATLRWQKRTSAMCQLLLRIKLFIDTAYCFLQIKKEAKASFCLILNVWFLAF